MSAARCRNSAPLPRALLRLLQLLCLLGLLRRLRLRAGYGWDGSAQALTQPTNRPHVCSSVPRVVAQPARRRAAVQRNSGLDRASSPGKLYYRDASL